MIPVLLGNTKEIGASDKYDSIAPAACAAASC